MNGTHQQFTPAVSATYAGRDSLTTSIALPEVDANNQAVLLQNVGPGTLFVFAGASSGGSISNAPGVIKLHDGETRMFANHAGFGSGVVTTMRVSGGGGLLQFTRGSVAPMWLFQSPATTTAI